MKLVEIVYAEKFMGYKNRRSHLRGMKFLCQKIRGMKFFRTKIRGTKILVDLQKIYLKSLLLTVVLRE